ncbi:MAG: adenylate kinase [Chlorobi bacterium]|nr:adenylate kinase [Chlorobiota bacterium]
MLNIALFGPPGAGKGTQSEFLTKKYNLFYISTGELLRKELAAGTKLGIQAKNIIAEGGLVSDEIIVQIIEKTIKSNSDANGFLFDGFPRTYIQAYILDGLMIKLNSNLDCLISIEVPEEESVRRLLQRGKTSGRTDDNETVIRNRLKEYKEKTLPVLEYYKERGLFYAVNGMQSIEKVTENIEKIINEILNKKLLNIVMFGHPGSGRGSLGKALAEKYDLEFVATGEMLDEEIKQNTEIGKQIKHLYENGQLVPDEIVIPLIEKKLQNSKNVRGFIFKGFPRTLVQSYILDGLLKKYDSYIAKIFDIKVDTLELIRRLDKRGKTDAAMPYDSSTEKIVKRLQEHEDKTIPVIEKYKETHDVTEIDGMPPFEEVLKNISEEIENSFKNLK